MIQKSLVKDFGFKESFSRDKKPYVCLRIACRNCPYRNSVDCQKYRENVLLYDSDFLERNKQKHHFL